ncbi:hypothetical protein BZA77DRAFT_24773 [Pyronema omphalodes]|nr:hypothetical protein BZA77DRAFT_24773 [Pyronema omphalodes]
MRAWKNQKEVGAVKQEFLLGHRHPIMRSHKAYGQELLPGLAYIDLIYQMFSANGYAVDELELRNVSIYQPLTIREGTELRLLICCEAVEEGRWSIRVEGSDHRDGRVSLVPDKYMTAEMHLIPKIHFAEKLDITQNVALAERQIPMDDIYSMCVEQELEHSGIMKAEGMLYITGDAVLMHLSLGPEALKTAGDTLFHPALIDASGVGCAPLFADYATDKKQLFLPLCYESFRAVKKIQTSCYAHVKRASVYRKNELMYASVDFYNSAGDKLAELKGFINKLVRGAQFINPNRSEDGNAGESSSTSRPSTATSKPRNSNHTVRGRGGALVYLSTLLADKLSQPEVETNVGYYEMGLDSSGMMEVVQTISEYTGETLPPTLLFEYTTIEQLAVHLDEQFPAVFAGETESDWGKENRLPHGEIHNASAPAYGYGSSPISAGLSAGNDEDMAIIGMAGRYPGAERLDQFWENLLEGKNGITEIPKERWDWTRFRGVRSASGRPISKWGGFIDRPEHFDPQFFRISPREAEILDPQERLFLETCWETIEDAGYTPETLTASRGMNKRNHVGVFVGVMHKDYALIGADVVNEGIPLSLNYAPIANRVSYFCNFHGPSLAVDTVCSSSLTAVHLAMESIKRGECEVALAGGVNLSLHPAKYISYGVADMHASDGFCHTFGKDGDGYVSGEGVGAVLLKPLQQAITDGDHIYAVIKGSSVNHVGKVSGITVPSPVAQSEMIVDCLQKSGVDPRTISYVEAHGTGTTLGDPIELQGLVKAFRQYTDDVQFCSIGSVKSNIGHAESAAGICGLQKAVLQLYHKRLVPSLHAEELNPHIHFELTPFYVQRKQEFWSLPDGASYPRRAGISSFGATGSNAHLILEEHSLSAFEKRGCGDAVVQDQPCIVPVSAKNKERLAAYVVKLRQYLLEAASREPEPTLPGLRHVEDIVNELLAQSLSVHPSVLDRETEWSEYSIDPVQLVNLRDVLNERFHVQLRELSPVSSIASVTEAIAREADETVLAVQDGAERNPVGDFSKRHLLTIGNVAYTLQVGREAMEERVVFLVQSLDELAVRLEEFAQGKEDIANCWQGTVKQNKETLSFLGSDIEELARKWVRERQYRKLAEVWAKGLNVDWHSLDHAGFRRIPLPTYPFAKESYWLPPAAGEAGSGGTDAVLHPWVQRNTSDLYALRYSSRFTGEETCVTEGGAGERSISEEALLDMVRIALREASGYGALEDEVVVAVTDAAWHEPLRMKNEDPHAGGEATEVHIELHPQEDGGVAYGIYSGSLSRPEAQLLHGEGVVYLEEQQNESVADEPVAEAATGETREDASSHREEEPYELLTYEETWQVEALGANAGPEEARTEQASRVLACCLNEPAHQRTVMERMQRLDEHARVVFLSQTAGDVPSKPGIYGVDEGDAESFRASLDRISREEGPVDALLYLWPLENAAYVKDSTPIVHLLQGAARARKRPSRLILAGEYQEELERCYAEAWIGVERSLGLIVPDMSVFAVLGKAEGGPERLGDWLERLDRELREGTTESVRYEEGRRYVNRIRALPQTEEPQEQGRVREGGTYLITGGCGGLGRLFARHLAEKGPVQLILTGRTELDDSKRKQLSELEAAGSRVMYVQADVSDRKGMKAGLERAKAVMGPITGLIHAAGVESLESVLEKSAEQYKQVLSPKMEGTLVLEDLLKEEPLEVVSYFSSTSAILGDFGSCDYAMGNRFLMSYGEYREAERRAGRVKGKTVTIQWPLWGEGGMGRGEAASVRLYLESSGQRLLETEEGLRAYDRAMGSEWPQQCILVGKRERVNGFLGKRKRAEQAVKGEMETEVPAMKKGKGRRAHMKGWGMEACLEEDLKEQIGKLLKMPVERLDRETNFADFGLDSIGLAQLARNLSGLFGISVTPIVFFTHSSIKQLVRYFFDEHHGTMEDFYRELEVDAAVPPSLPGLRRPVRTAPIRRPISVASEFVKPRPIEAPEPIAVVGMSGRFPGADTIEDLWENLLNQISGISEVPANRRGWKKRSGDPVSQWGAFMNNIDQFDPLFFELSPWEAQRMDPQQRVFLQEAWHALEDAGYMGERIRGTSCGVFAGVEESQYGALSGNDGYLNSNQNATLPARIAYKLDLKGPVMALTTACSSGLVALHQACQALRNGECEMAIAGGVSLLVSPLVYDGLGKYDMLSPDGRCRVFDQRANGMVPGEAATVVVLKPLSKAEADGDLIYGCIKASGINANGHSSGITAPNPHSQTQLIQDVYAKYGIEPADIDFVLAHSTGSPLGDPLEIEALTRAYPHMGESRSRYCVIGSIKPLLGHTFAASGIVNLICMLMSMKHGIIPGTAGYEQSNEYIHLEGTPFRIHSSNTSWETSNSKPKLGALGATGISGTNAHIVVEEYVPSPISGEKPTVDEAPVVIAWSAKTLERLRTYAKTLLSYSEKHPKLAMRDIAYALQTGRESMDWRAAFVAETKAHFHEVLRNLSAHEKSGTVYVNRLSLQEKETMGIDGGLREGESSLHRLMHSRDYRGIAKHWAEGDEPDWRLLYGQSAPVRISLPGYPFATESCWYEAEQEGACSTEYTAPMVHPLVHRNISDLAVQRYESTFSGEEFYFSDHVVRDKKVFPGAAYMEMARAALNEALPGGVSDTEMIRLKHIGWAHPISTNGKPVTVRIELIPRKNDGINFEICTGTDEGNPSCILHSQGNIEVITSYEPPKLEITKVMEACRDYELSGEQCYEIYRKLGINYGSGHRGLKSLHVGFDEQGKKQVLARLRLPRPQSEPKRGDGYVMHPGMLDSALQATLGFFLPEWAGDQEESQPALLSLPFSMDEVEVFGEYEEDMWAFIRSDDLNEEAQAFRKYDIDVCTSAGRYCTRIKGYSTRVMENPEQQADAMVLVEESKGTAERVNMAQAGNPMWAGSRDKESMGEAHRMKAVNFIKGILASVINLSANQIEADVSMDHYGIDSVMVIQLTKRLEESFGSLPKTLFFEYQNLSKLTDYFIKHHGDRLSMMIDLEDQWNSHKIATDRNGAFDMLKNPADSILKRSWRTAARADTVINKDEPGDNGPLDIAVIGLAGRYPGADTLYEFWKNLCDGVDSITEIPMERWDHTQYTGKNQNNSGRLPSKWGGFIRDVDCFDPLFFHISPREAEMMDPQERLFLECVYEAMEDAGYTRQNLGGSAAEEAGQRVGVFVGAMYQEYQLYGAQEQARGRFMAMPGNPSAIANRVSYFCNFNGPSLAVDTACSSSLTALHLACQSIRQGDCEVAFAGGVNVSIHPNKYIMLAQGNFTSSKGRCESFGEGGDGYVPGEGIGVALLKPLHKALEDGDHIYGVIKATSINHGGKTNGYTVPNPIAQAGVVSAALKSAQVEPWMISYVEAHGTGTSLGDPIEIAGLERAFGAGDDRRYCSIGSVKSNIGHCESAAGIAGLTKILLQMKHRKLVPSLHSASLNPNINFANSPFTVQQNLVEWEQPSLNRNGVEVTVPRIAGISSFGAGGSNAHVIIEEFDAPVHGFDAQPPTDHGKPALIVLSAKQEDSLRKQASRLLQYLRSDEGESIPLMHIAYTLQVGREQMEERLGMLVHSVEDLQLKLERFMAREGNIPDIYRGHSKRHKDVLNLFASDEDMQEALGNWILRGKYAKLLELWVNGMPMEWKLLYKGVSIQRVSLPTYPFERKRYWFPTDEAEAGASALPAQAQSEFIGDVRKSFLHPLLQKNVSDFKEQRYSTVLTGSEFYLKDHLVYREKMLPGAAYLEMAGEAMILASNARSHGSLVFSDVAWLRPLVVEKQAVEALIRIMPEKQSHAHFEVYSSHDLEQRDHVHALGNVSIREFGGHHRVDLEEVRGRCDMYDITQAECYEAYRSAGLDYGPSFQAVESIVVGQEIALAAVSLPDGLHSTAPDFRLHPVVLDAAFHASIGLFWDQVVKERSAGKAAISLPFAIDELECFGNILQARWIVLETSSVSDDISGADITDVRKINIQVCDERGDVLLQAKGFSSRVLDRDNRFQDAEKEKSGNDFMLEEKAETQEIPVGNISMVPRWKAHQPEIKIGISQSKTGRMVVVGGTDEQIQSVLAYHPQAEVVALLGEDAAEDIASKLGNQHEELEHLVWLVPKGLPISFTDAALNNGQSASIFQTLRIFKALSLLGLCQRELSWTVITTEAVSMDEEMVPDPVHAAIHGLVGTIAKEYPRWNIRLIDLGEHELPTWSLYEIPQDRQGRAWASRRGIWYRQELIPYLSSNNGRTLFREKGVYVVIGGAGSVGQAWSEYMIRKYDAQVIWIGRRPHNAEIEAKIQRMAAFGPAPVYMSADASKAADMLNVRRTLKTMFSVIHGVIHSAMDLSERSLPELDEETLRRSLASKMDTSVCLANTFEGEALDFVLFFSSIMSFTKAPKQADYAAGCMFMDAFAAKMASGWPCTVKLVNWGYWNTIQYAASSDYEQMGETYYKLSKIGLGLVELPQAVEVVERLLTSRDNQVAFMNTTKPFLIEGMNTQTIIREASSVATTREEGFSREEPGVEWCKDYLKNIIADALKVPVQRIDSAETLDVYGLDSVVMVQLVQELRTHFSDLGNTLFFEHPTIDDLSAYLLQEYPDTVSELFSHKRVAPAELDETNNAETIVPQPAESDRSGLRTSYSGRFIRSEEYRPIPKDASMDVGEEPIAVIAMSGRFPGAETVEELWERLKAGEDCISEIPSDRWPMEGFYNSDIREALSNGESYCKWGGFLKDVDQFDPSFFQLSQRDAELMDPQERLFMECVWELLENAGYSKEEFGRVHQRKVGVFVGAMYQPYHAVESDYRNESVISLSSSNSLANRISYFFNLQGPSMAVDTACSSSAMAVHLACESLRKGECSAAIAGGVNLSIHPKKYVGLSQFQLVGSHPGSRSFSAGDGYLPAEAAGSVLLKPLSQAVADGDEVLALIRSTSTNHNGHISGFTSPNPAAQEELISTHFRQSGIDPRTITYVEAAANGVPAGDAVELSALTKAFRQHTADEHFCAIGTVKSNIGHAEGASGISQLIKTVLQLKHGQLVPTIKSEPLNPDISLENTPFYIQRELTDWQAPVLIIDEEVQSFSRRAALSSFGAGGTNVHFILEEYEPSEAIQKDSGMESGRSELVVVSAKSRDELTKIVENILGYLEISPVVSLADLAYTLQVGREAMQSRLALVVRTREELMEGLRQFISISHGFSPQSVSLPMYYEDLNVRTHSLETVWPEMAAAMASSFVPNRVSSEWHHLAESWIQGKRISWYKLHEGIRRKRLKLPTYPFNKKRCWVAARPFNVLVQTAVKKEMADSVDCFNGNHSDGFATVGEIRSELAAILSTELGLPSGQIAPDKRLQEYGADSMTLLKIQRELNYLYQIECTLRELLEQTTLNDLTSFVAERVKTHPLTGCDDEASTTLEKYKRGELSLDDVNAWFDKNVVNELQDLDGKDNLDRVLEQYQQGDLGIEDVERMIERMEKGASL